MQVHDEPVEVRRRLDAPHQPPEQFLWRGRLWQVREVLAHRVRTTQPSGGRTTAVPLLDPPEQQEVWRVEAGRGLLGATAVVDLVLDADDGDDDGHGDGHWRLAARHD